MDFGHWQNRTGLSHIDTNDYEGFIYRIKFEDGCYYWGKKKFWSHRAIKKAGKQRRSHVWYESEWRCYTSSSNEVQAKLGEGLKAEYDMVAVFATARTLGYAENLAIINSGAYEDKEHGINWRLERVQGKLGMKGTDATQLEHLKCIVEKQNEIRQQDSSGG